MKLSEKGLLKLKSFVLIMNNFDVTTEDIEFEPDDFTGAVCLTIDEVQSIRSNLCVLLFLTKDSYRNNVQKDIDLLWKRIEQVENK